LVEAEGIEPSSESHSLNASTCVSDDLSSSPSLPSAGSPATSRRIYLSPHPVGTMGAQPELRRSVPPYGRGQAERGSLIRLPVRSFRWQLSRSVLFNEVNSTPGTQRTLHDLRFSVSDRFCEQSASGLGPPRSAQPAPYLSTGCRQTVDRDCFRRDRSPNGVAKRFPDWTAVGFALPSPFLGSDGSHPP
jgi:hypothetical protein